MKITIVESIVVAAMIIVIAGSVFLAYRTWALGGIEKDYNIVCLGGHEYWRANFMAKGFLGIKLDDNGKPISCE